MTSYFRGFLVGVMLGVGFLLSLTVVSAEGNNAGASYLGMCHRLWPCEESLDVFDGLPVKRVRWLTETFGRTCSCPKKFLKLPGKKEVATHLVNGTCFPERGRRCDKGEPFHGESIASADRKLRRRNAGMLRRVRVNFRNTRRVLKHADADTRILLSLCLECPLSHEARRRGLLKEARAFFPGGEFIDSVLTQRCLKGLICEKHGAAPKVSPPCAIDTDGDDFREIDVRKFLAAGAQCVRSDLWCRPFNLLDENRMTFEFPLRRSHPPTRADFRALRRWLAR